MQSARHLDHQATRTRNSTSSSWHRTKSAAFTWAVISSIARSRKRRAAFGSRLAGPSSRKSKAVSLSTPSLIASKGDRQAHMMKLTQQELGMPIDPGRYDSVTGQLRSLRTTFGFGPNIPAPLLS